MRSHQIGIIGGGQLGMFLLQSAIPFPCHVSIYDPNPQCSASYFTNHFQKGECDDTEKILEFAKDCDSILFETEKASLKALLKLQKQGKKVLSSPQSLEWIQDKGTQRQKLKEAGFPVPDFQLLSASESKDYSGNIPVVQKWRTGGYDGKGVNMINSTEDIEDVDSVFEELIDIKHEVSIIIARSPDGKTAVYPSIEMVFNQEANLVDYLISPARIDAKLETKLKDLAVELATQLNFEGIYAIEFFIDQNDQIFVNEIAPRPHNSGHHTLSANVTSQYEQHIRMALGLPLGSPEMLSPCLMVNLLGEGETGPTNYTGLEQVFDIPNVQVMLYGKDEVRHHRKMGHALILESDHTIALEKMEQIKNTLTITSHG